MDLSPLLRARANYTKHTRRHRYAVAACAQCTQIWAELNKWEKLARAEYSNSISKSRLQSVVPPPVAPAAIK